MLKKAGSFVLVLLAVVVAAAAVWYGGGWVWHWLLALHGIH